MLFTNIDRTKVLEAARNKFKREGDVEFAVECAHNGGIENTKYLALYHLNKALEALDWVA